jgi:hypothetical protein
MHGFGVKAQPEGALELQHWEAGALQFSKPVQGAAHCSLTIDEQAWMFESEHCINGLAHGSGLAVSLDGERIIVDGQFVLGEMVSGSMQQLVLQEG